MLIFVLRRSVEKFNYFNKNYLFVTEIVVARKLVLPRKYLNITIIALFAKEEQSR